MLQSPIFGVVNAIGAGAPQSGLFVSLASFLARPNDPGEEVDQYGAVILTGYQPVAGLQNLPCMFAPQAAAPSESDTVRMADQYDTKREWHLTLNGYYPNVNQRYLLSVDGGDLYQVMAVEWDSQRTMTRCAVRKYEI